MGEAQTGAGRETVGGGAMIDPGTPITAKAIIAQTAERYGVKPSVILGGDRARVASIPRQAAMAAVREATGYSFPQIGRIFKRDHTTVLYGIRAHEARQQEKSTC